MKRKTGAGTLDLLKTENTSHAETITAGLNRQVQNLSAPLKAGKLRLSPTEWRSPDDLRNSPYNKPFQDMKDQAYWHALRKDIEDAREITDPILITPDNVIISGHSRCRIARELLRDGYEQFEKVPVRVINTVLSEQERKMRVYLGNLSRFEIDQDTKLMLYAEIWPEYFNRDSTLGSKQGRPKKSDTVPHSSLEEITEHTGISSRQLKRNKQMYQKAKDAAQQEGRAEPSKEDISAARDQLNAQRKQKEAADNRHTKDIHTEEPGITDDDIVVDVSEPAEEPRQATTPAEPSPAEEVPTAIVDDTDPVYTSDNIHPEKNYRYNNDRPSAGLMVMIQYLEGLRDSLTILDNPNALMQLATVNDIIANAENLLRGMYEQEVENGKRDLLSLTKIRNITSGEVWK